MAAIGSRLPSAPYVKLGDGPPLRKAVINEPPRTVDALAHLFDPS